MIGLFNFCSCAQDSFVMVLAPVYAPLLATKISVNRDSLLASPDTWYKDPARCCRQVTSTKTYRRAAVFNCKKNHSRGNMNIIRLDNEPQYDHPNQRNMHSRLTASTDSIQMVGYRIFGGNLQY